MAFLLTENMDNKKKSKKYRFGYYNTLYKALVIKFKRRYKPIIDKEALQSLDRPCLIFCNHGSIFDFILAGAVILPKKAVFVTTRRTMLKKPFNWVVNKAPHILRDQFSADVKSIIEMRDALKQGYNVVLYPEGKVSTCGVTNHIPKATGKLVKLFKVPVVTILSKGNWAVKPSWASHLRDGRVELTSKLILDEEQIEKMSQEELQQVIEKELSYNENLYQIENNYEFRGLHFAEGLEKVLYKCPVCQKEFCMTTKDFDITCTNCGFTAKYNRNGKITSSEENFNFDRIDLWYDYEKESLRKELESDDFKIVGRVSCEVANEKKAKYDVIGEGDLIMDKNAIKFVPDNNGEVLTYKIDKVESIPFTVGVQIYLIIDGKNYEFTFTDKLMSTKYNMAVELLSEGRDVEKKKRKGRG